MEEIFLETEQAAWFARPLEERQKYSGAFVRVACLFLTIQLLYCCWMECISKQIFCRAGRRVEEP
jgi:hypothetical protein